VPKTNAAAAKLAKKGTTPDGREKAGDNAALTNVVYGRD
jgi:hypothetical protein